MWPTNCIFPLALFLLIFPLAEKNIPIVLLQRINKAESIGNVSFFFFIIDLNENDRIYKIKMQVILSYVSTASSHALISMNEMYESSEEVFETEHSNASLYLSLHGSFSMFLFIRFRDVDMTTKTNHISATASKSA